MRYITHLVLVSTLVVLFGSTVCAQSTAGVGLNACRDMLSVIGNNEGQAQFTFRSWSQGFMSALNRSRYSNGLGIVNISDSEGQWLWLQNYCRDNPLESFLNASYTLFEELRTKQGIE
jgi:hypothetical protein